MFTFPARTVALATVVAALGGTAAGCGGSSDHDEGGHAAPAGTTTQAASGNAVDRAFVQQMVPHHVMAVQMAKDAPTRATKPQIRALGRTITTAQQQEIEQLRAAARKLGVTPAPVPMDHGSMDHGDEAAMDGDDAMEADARTLGLTMEELGMSMDMSALEDARPFDRAFIDAMIPHHQGAIRMARAQLDKGSDPELRRLATAIVRDQEREIRRMNGWRTAWYGRPSPSGGVPGR